jgi:hypothetical protein
MQFKVASAPCAKIDLKLRTSPVQVIASNRMKKDPHEWGKCCSSTQVGKTEPAVINLTPY